jgi:hypothetical protein
MPELHPSTPAFQMHENKYAQGPLPRVDEPLIAWAQSETEFAQSRPRFARSTDIINALSRDYAMLSSGDEIAEVIMQWPVVATLLREAIPYLREAFGEEGLLQLEAVSSDEGGTLRAVVRLLDFEGDAEAALDEFTKSWWIGNCHRAGASIAFDYESQDATVRMA